MIQAIFYRDHKGRYQGFSIKGHAGYAESGQDIICASVSALAINTVNSVEALTGDRFLTKVDDTDGVLLFKFPSKSGAASQLLIRSLYLGILNIQKEYGKQYLTILIRRCKRC